MRAHRRCHYSTSACPPEQLAGVDSGVRAQELADGVQTFHLNLDVIGV